MQIRLKLMGVLKAKTPDGGLLELADGATVADVFTALEVAGDSIQVVTVNGSLEKDRKRSLADGDEVSLIPPVGGG